MVTTDSNIAYRPFTHRPQTFYSILHWSFRRFESVAFDRAQGCSPSIKFCVHNASYGYFLPFGHSHQWFRRNMEYTYRLRA